MYSHEEVSEMVKEFAPGAGLTYATYEKNGRHEVMTMVMPMLRMDHLLKHNDIGTEEELDAALTMLAELQDSGLTFLGLNVYCRAQTRNAMTQILDLIDQPDVNMAKLHYQVTGLIEDFDAESENLEETARDEVAQARANAEGLEE